MCRQQLTQGIKLIWFMFINESYTERGRYYTQTNLWEHPNRVRYSKLASILCFFFQVTSVLIHCGPLWWGCFSHPSCRWVNRKIHLCAIVLKPRGEQARWEWTSNVKRNSLAKASLICCIYLYISYGVLLRH